ncbi:hypothetical protein FRC11_004354, partial [Ceratobasidium sp. 423]
ERQAPIFKKIHALLIGIDSYPNLRFLRGAVADVNAIKSFLELDLGIPEEHIVALCNKQATRYRILQRFQELWNNKDIQPGDPILIYYAGHGGLREADEGWKKRYGAQKIQVIFPYDYLEKDPKPRGTEPHLVNCIPDTTIATLLNNLAARKGDNITVIFDSCHSASGTRTDAVEPGGRLYRSEEVAFDIPPEIDDEFFTSNGIMLPSPEKQPREAQHLLHTDQSSHIHFAACGIDQEAMEQDGRGIFTDELLKKIRKNGVSNITYHNLVKCLELASSTQSPQCYGKHKDRILFNDRIYSCNVVHVILTDGTWVLEAGEASGVTEGSIWRVHKTAAEGAKPVGNFKVTELYSAAAILEPLDLSGEWATGSNTLQLYARRVCIGEGRRLALKVWMSPEDRKRLFGDPNFAGNTEESGMDYIITRFRDSAEIALEVHPPDSTPHGGEVGVIRGKVVFYLCDTMAKRYGAGRLQQRVSARREEVEPVLFAAARWRWHLRRRNSDSTAPSQMVSMRMLKVAKTSRPGFPVKRLQEPEPIPIARPAQAGSGQISLRITPQISLTAPDSVVVDNLVEFNVDSSGALYGFRLKCNSEAPGPLYLRMFYFNATDFSINDMFGHNVAIGENLPDITPGGELFIGDGADGGSAIRFNISPGQNFELGYMKVFWSTKPLELDYIKQGSAFKMKTGDKKSRGAEVFPDVAAEKWGTTCTALILRKPA